MPVCLWTSCVQLGNTLDLTCLCLKRLAWNQYCKKTAETRQNWVVDQNQQNYSGTNCFERNTWYILRLSNHTFAINIPTINAMHIYIYIAFVNNNSVKNLMQCFPRTIKLHNSYPTLIQEFDGDLFVKSKSVASLIRIYTPALKQLMQLLPNDLPAINMKLVWSDLHWTSHIPH